MTLRETLERLRNSRLLAGDEETAKMKIILPILHALGWDIHGDDIEYEYLINELEGAARDTSRKADVVLLSRSGQPRAFIEAKAVGKEFASRDVRQVVRYATDQRAGEVSICALTNGPVWWLYLSPQQAQQGQPKDRKFAELHLLEHPLDHVEDDLRAFLDKDALVGDKAVKQARRVLKASVDVDRLGTKLPGIWRELAGQAAKDEPHPALLRLVTKLVHERTGLRPSPEQVAGMLAGSPLGETTADPHDPGPPPPARPAPMPPSKPRQASRRPSSKAKRRRKGQRMPKPIAFVLWGQQRQVTHWYQVLVGVAEAVYGRRRDDFDHIGNLGRKYATHSHEEPTGARTYRQVSDTNWWLDTNYNSELIEEHARDILQHFSYNRSDLKVYREGDHPPMHDAPTAGGSAQPQYLSDKPPSAIWPLPVAIANWKKMTAGGKPRGLTLWDEPEAPMSSWIDVPVAVAEALHDRHRDEFARIGDLCGKKRRYASTSRGDLFNPKPVGETGWHIDGNLSGPGTLQRARLFLEHFGHEADDLRLLYE